VPPLKQQVVGDMVRKLREQRGLSLRALATATEFSPSFISQLENGQVSPSIASMERIASTLGVTLGEFFAALGSSESGMIVRVSERVEIPSRWSHAVIEALSPMNRGRLTEPILITLEPGGRTGKHPSARDSREEFAFVVEGAVELTLGPDVFALQAGDAVTILRGELRRWTNSSTNQVRILIVAVI
jgi:XRE family transcriptional regulator, regulator of sulfur utilization